MLRSVRSVTLLLVTATVIALASPSVDATHNNQGTVKVHDNETENPEMRNVPHVSCDFWIEGFKLGGDTGWIQFYTWPPTGDKSKIYPTVGGSELNWTADSGSSSGEYHFLAGPFQLPAGHYRVEIFTHDGHPGSDSGHFAKAKVFWVEPCDSVVVNPPCPLIVEAKATSTDGDARITLTWTAVADADGYVVYRATAGGDFDQVGETSGSVTTFVDEDVTASVSYEYYVTAVIDGVESENCASVQVSAIPFFPGLVLGAVALAGSLGAYVWLRRKA